MPEQGASDRPPGLIVTSSFSSFVSVLILCGGVSGYRGRLRLDVKSSDALTEDFGVLPHEIILDLHAFLFGRVQLLKKRVFSDERA